MGGGAILELPEHHAIQLLERLGEIRVEVTHEAVALAGRDVVAAQFDHLVIVQMRDTLQCGARVRIRVRGGDKRTHAECSKQQD